MRPLFPPSTDRDPPRAEELMKSLLQDNVGAEPGTLHHAMFGGIAAELDRATSRFLRQDPRPWRSDTRREGAVLPADGSEEKVPFWEMVYGVPGSVTAQKVRHYDYNYQSGGYGVVGSDGTVVEPSDVARAAETRDGLYFQVGDRLYRLTEESRSPEEIDISQTPAGAAERWTLASASETSRSLLVGEPRQSIDVSAQIGGTDIVVRGTGVYEAALNYTGVASVTDGEDVTQLPDYEQARNLYNADGDRLSYVVNADGTISIGSVLEESALDGAGSGYTLFYEASHTYSHTTTAAPPLPSPGEDPLGEMREGRMSFSDQLENMDRMPSAGDVEAAQTVDRLCRAPIAGESVWIDAQGFVGEIPTSHPIESLMLARHHVAVANVDQVSVVEPASENVLFTQGFSEEVVGVTWTKDIEMGVVVATGSGFDVYALRPDRDTRSDGLTPANS